MEQLVYVCLSLLGLYAVIGLLFSIAFLWKGVHKIDEGVHGSSIWFKAIIWPGVVAFWPGLLLKWIKS